MARLTNSDLPPFWGPEVGDFIVAKYLASKPGKFGQIHELEVFRGAFRSEHRGKVISTVPIPIQLRKDDPGDGYLPMERTTISVGGNVILERALEKVRPGTVLEIHYLGKQWNSNGSQEYHNYEAYSLDPSDLSPVDRSSDEQNSAAERFARIELDPAD